MIPDINNKSTLDKYKNLRAENERLQKDLDEQCILLGKSGSREAQLLTRIGELEAFVNAVSRVDLNEIFKDNPPAFDCIFYWKRQAVEALSPKEGKERV
jgi:hypothetical protein